jgi:hypothetical protein
VKYPLTRWNKVRNYVLGHNELGLPLDPIHEHFVKTGLFSQEYWSYLVADPIGHVDPPNVAVQRETPPTAATLDSLYENTKANKRDLDEHFPKLRELASQCPRVTEFSKRRESFVALAAGKPTSLVSHNTEAGDTVAQQVAALAPFAKIDGQHYRDVPAIDETDLLFIDIGHTSDDLAEQLRRYAPSVTRFIALHDTVVHMDNGEDNKPGFAYALRPFFAEHPEWFVAYHTTKQYGLTVFGRRAEDRPEKEIHAWAPGFGPGTELSKLLADIGIQPNANCSCKAMALQMDVAGIEKCRSDIEKIVEGIEKNQAGWGWKEKLSASFKVAAAGYFSIKSLVEEAIRRAEEKQKGALAA